MLASMRFFLRFIDLEDQFDNFGFTKKYGATFKINEKREAYTDFSVSLGPGGHSWNVARAEADDLIFRHAGKEGAHAFDGIKVTNLEFVPYDDYSFTSAVKLANPGKPVAAKWCRKDGSSGRIEFDYVVDASGRSGLISTKYLKNRTTNEGLKNIANWSYWKNAERYGEGGQQNSPFFEALLDGSGWCWAIPLHNDTLSVGVVMRQDLYFGKKKADGSLGQLAMYKTCLENAPHIHKLLENAEICSDVRMASDWSYSASAYAGPNFRIIGDAGCFIDPYFSSGVHLALTSGLSAAMTIQAVRRGDTNEFSAAKWHSYKVTEGYTRFLLVVMSVLRQIRKQNAFILSEEHEEGFDNAFLHIQPVIQGQADTGERKPEEVATGVNFALEKFQSSIPEQQKAILEKVQQAGHDTGDLEKLTPTELTVLHNLVERQLALTRSDKNLKNFATDIIDGWTPRFEQGSLGLVKVSKINGANKTDDLKNLLGVNGSKDSTNDDVHGLSTIEVL